MERATRLSKMFDYAKSMGMCRTKKEFSNLLGLPNSNLSHAFNGDTRYLTDNMLLRVNEGLGNIFSLRWLLYGDGEMLVSNNVNIERTHTHAQETQGTNNDDRVAELESRVAELQSKVEMLEYIIETQKRLIKEIDQKRDKSVSANVHSA